MLFHVLYAVRAANWATVAWLSEDRPDQADVIALEAAEAPEAIRLDHPGLDLSMLATMFDVVGNRKSWGGTPVRPEPVSGRHSTVFTKE